MYKKLIIALVLIMMICSSVCVPVTASYLGSKPEWYDDEYHTINIWKNVRDNGASLKVYSLAQSGFTDFSDYIIAARDQWDMFSFSTGTGNSYNVAIIGGDYDYLSQINPSLPTDQPGYTTFGYLSQGTDTYSCTKNGVMFSISVNYMQTAFCYIYKRTINLTENTRCAMVHELGHAFGWRGHSNDADNVMHQYNYGIYTLTNSDKVHISQFYQN